MGLILASTATVWGQSYYTAVELTPGGYTYSLACAASGGQQVGAGQNASDGNFHALLWSATAGSYVDLNPSGCAGSVALGANGTQQVGWLHRVDDTNDHAALWSGTAGSCVDLNPSGFTISDAAATTGAQQVGFGTGAATGNNYHALLWSGTAASCVDLNPSGVTTSMAWAAAGTKQVGYGVGFMTSGNPHALLWSGTAGSYVDLNPTGFTASVAWGAGGTQQVGSGYGLATAGGDHALLWSGTAGSGVDLNPGGLAVSEALGTNGTQQVGYGNGLTTGGNDHALVWSGTAASCVDLSQFLPGGFTSSWASGIDSAGNVVGYAEDGSGNDHAFLWTLSTFGAINPTSTINLTSPLSATIVKGGTGTLGVTVASTAAGDPNLRLNYPLSAAVTVGIATLGAVTPPGGGLAPGSAQPCTVTASSANIGVNTIQFTAVDPNALGNPQIASVTLTVLDHSLASFDPNSTQAAKTLNFGGVLKNGNAGTMSFSIGNQGATYRVALDLTGIDANGSAALATNLSTFSGLAAGLANSYAASLATGVSGTYRKTLTLHLSDSSLYPGADGNQTMTLTLAAVVGNASADRSNLMTSFGPALNAVTGLGSSYAGLQSTVTGTTAGLGEPMVGTTATILAGANNTGSDTSVSMQWRTRTTAEAYPTQAYPPTPAASYGLASDVLNLSGMANDGAGQTDPYVLEMDYDPNLLVLGAGMSEQILAERGWIYLAWYDSSTGWWENAVGGNFGGTAQFCGIGDWSDAGQPGLGDDLGRWGVDPATHTVWAVLNHNSEFSAVPEPATLSLLLLGGLALLRRKATQGRGTRCQGDGGRTIARRRHSA